MLKALKWAYDLGVRQERVRIASHLQMESQQARASNDTMIGMLRGEDQPAPNQKRKERLEIAVKVNDRIQNIIDNLFYPKGEWTPPASLMFPDDKHKGEM